MPLALIKDVLEADAAATMSLIAQFWSDTERRINEGRNVVEYIYQLIRGGPPMGYDVKTREVEGTQAVSVTQEVFVKDLPMFIHNTGTPLYRHVAGSGGRAEGQLT
jgi:hypothetical protein